MPWLTYDWDYAATAGNKVQVWQCNGTAPNKAQVWTTPVRRCATAACDGWAGDHDRAFTDARLAEIRRLLDDEKLRDRGIFAERVSTVSAHQQWAAGYDAEAGGGLFATDEPVVAGYLSGREPGVALDAAYGPGRFAELLARRGHRVIGVDSSTDMLACARRRVPDGEFGLGELDRLPLPDDSWMSSCARWLWSTCRTLSKMDMSPTLATNTRVQAPAVPHASG